MRNLLPHLPKMRARRGGSGSHVNHGHAPMQLQGVGRGLDHLTARKWPKLLASCHLPKATWDPVNESPVSAVTE